MTTPTTISIDGIDYVRAECATVWPCQTHLLVRPQGADNAPA